MREFAVTQALPRVFAATLPDDCPGTVTVTVTFDATNITWDQTDITFDET